MYDIMFSSVIFDCTNAFQCMFEDNLSKRVYCYLPPYYISWYNSRYPHDPIDQRDRPFVTQAAQLIQGSPHAANCWQENLHLQLTNTQYIRNNIDHSFYTKQDAHNNLLAILSITIAKKILSQKIFTINSLMPLTSQLLQILEN